ncbi:PKD domain-containing protein [Bacteroidota bacterium]
MKKTTLLISIFSLVFCFGINAQFASFSTGLEGWECDSLELNLYNYSDTFGLINPTVEWVIDGEMLDGAIIPTQFIYDYYPPMIKLYPGYYTVTLNLYQDGIWFDSDQTNIEVPTDVTSFTVSSGGEACPGEELQFWFDDRIMEQNVSWTFGDNSVFEPQHIFNYASHTYYQAGTYDVTLIIDHYCGVDTVIQPVLIGGAAKPTVNAWIANGPFCPSDPVVFGVDGEFNSYLWNFGDGTQSTLRNPTHVYPAEVPTTYTATVSVVNSCGNSNTDTIDVTFVDDLTADAYFDYYLGGEASTACPGSPVEFESYGAGFYEWDFGDGSFSNEQKPVNYFTQPGWYYITLTLWNGCGDMDEYMDSLEVQFNPGRMPYADFYMEIDDMHDEDWSDTVVVCPGMLIDFKDASDPNSEGPLSYEWDFGDGSTAISKNASHVYSAAPLLPYEVTLVVSNPCGGTDTLRKYVLVDNGLLPMVDAAVTPLVVCSGDEVFFYLSNGLEEGSNYVFDIDFGDGQSLNNATTFADPIIQTIANHAYTGTPGQTFDFVFSTTNVCGNTSDFNGTITITDNDQLTPFLYVDNTASGGGSGPQWTDWSQRRSPTDHDFLIHVTWPSWPGVQDQFGVFFWYEGFFPGTEGMGPANGYVLFQTSDIQMGDSVHAYIPVDPNYPPVVGFAAGWSCDGTYPQGIEPEVWGMQTDWFPNPVNSFPITPGGYTNMASVGPQVLLNGTGLWDGLCGNESPHGEYYYPLNPYQYIQLSLDRETGEYSLSATSDQDGFEYITGVSYGDYSIFGIDTIEFYETGGDCGPTPGRYLYSRNGDKMDLTVLSDPCALRIKYLTDSTFNRHPDFGLGMMGGGACPSDKVQFSIAGGISYIWDFGDGSPTTTERYPIHTYGLEGEYDAFVISTNGCGRIDTTYSTVNISNENLPYAGFWWDGYDFQRLEPIQFEYEEYFDQAGNYSYSWNFGDGNTSTLMNPVHSYQKSGDYTIKLTVTNGCGSSTSTQMIYISETILNCEAKIGIDSVDGKTAYFSDISRGEVTDWFWDFGDGFTSTIQNPDHTYDYDGIFWVCLGIYDSISDCSHQVCRQVQIGAQQCIADFTTKINTATSKVQFTDRSTNATEWFWDFGDGNFSDLKDPAHTYAEPGWYEVCLSIYNGVTDCFAYRCIELQVGEEDPNFCYADFSYFVDEATNTVKFTDESSENVTNLYWTFGDGTFIEDRNPIHTYRGPGIYEICLIVFDAITGCADEICQEIPVGVATCNLRADFAFFIDITKDAVTFNNRSGGTVTDYFWNFGDGVTSSAKDPSHSYEDPGFYLVTLSIMDEATGCNDHLAEFIQIGTVDCRAAFEYKVDATTRNVQFYNKSQGTLSEYYWDFSDGTFSDAKDPVHQFTKAGLYFVSLTVINDNGLCMDFIFEPIQVGTIECAAKFTYFIDSTTNVAYFTPEAIGTATDYLWYFGDGAISTGKEAKHQFKQAGYFTIGLNTFDEATGCMDYWEEVILIGSAGEDCRAGFSYVSDPTTKKVKFGDRSKGKIVDYIWDFGDGDISLEQNPVHQYAVGGYYLVCQTVVNEFGIPNTFCDFVQMATSDAERCFAEFFFTVDSATKTVDFVQESHGTPDKFLWNFGDGTTSTAENPQHTYTSSGYFVVELSISNSTTKCTSNNFDLINVAEGNKGLRAAFAYLMDSSNLKADTYPVDFVGVSLGDAGKLKWDFGDGTIDTTTMNPTHVYQTPGKYTACLTISNPISGDKNTSCQDVVTRGYLGETWYADADGDGLGNPGVSQVAFDQPTGYVADNTDCDDSDATVTTGPSWYRDADGDTFGSPSDSTTACTVPTGYVANRVDCNDADNSVTTTVAWYRDADGDTFGNPNDSIVACSAPTGYVANNDDLDDSDASIINSINGGQAWDNMVGNYPNPFNNTTYIVYEIGKRTFVDLSLFDQSGRMIDKLVREDQIAGSYRMEYDGSRLEGGIYTLRLATEHGVYTARMVVH